MNKEIILKLSMKTLIVAGALVSVAIGVIGLNANQTNAACEELRGLIFQSPINEEAVAIAEECYEQGDALAHSYLQSLFLATYREFPNIPILELGTPDSESSPESNFKAYRILTDVLQEKGTSDDQERRAISYARWSIEHGAVYPSLFVIYNAILNGNQNAKRVTSSIDSLSKADRSAVNQLLKHWNSTCYYPPEMRPDPAELDVSHYWQSPEFVQTLYLLQTNACQHVDTFLEKNNLRPRELAEFFETILTDTKHKIEGSTRSLETKTDDISLLETSILPKDVENWVVQYKSYVPENALNWCDQNHSQELNLCYRTAFSSDLECMRDLSVAGYIKKIRQSGEYDECRAIRWEVAKYRLSVIENEG
ncbi:hypothetical protein [Thalassospira lohafexi]|uniref:Uncharacterized protein n=1 Tax=Thalassospira lohafexi TaxID=744227 RepID=A0A2N3L417_9PROT|nr:hypothetical protein [Thalassospira lohafexi]PKR57579.1 hypothetical protein COO92_16735 [Thalassospira lohafexi]